MAGKTKKYALIIIASSILGFGQESNVIVNDQRLDERDVRYYEQKFNTRIQSGSYWYDPLSGAWGFKGGPTVGLIPAGLRLGGHLKADASNGKTGIWVNGRQLHYQEVRALRMMFATVYPGRYWLTENGTWGRENGPALGNLYLTIQKMNRRSGGGNTYYHNGYTGISSGSGNGFTYVMGKDFSYTSW
jgi:hypothetical protein